MRSCQADETSKVFNFYLSWGKIYKTEQNTQCPKTLPASDVAPFISSCLRNFLGNVMKIKGLISGLDSMDDIWAY